MSGYDLHPEAYGDLEAICEYIVQENLDAARRVLTRIFDAMDRLVAFPGQGHTRADLTSRPLRFWRVYDYLIAYAPDQHPLWIVAVIHGRRSPRVIAALLRSRE